MIYRALNSAGESLALVLYASLLFWMLLAVHISRTWYRLVFRRIVDTKCSFEQRCYSNVHSPASRVSLKLLRYICLMITDARNILVSWYIFKLIGEIITKWKLGLMIKVFRSIDLICWLHLRYFARLTLDIDNCSGYSTVTKMSCHAKVNSNRTFRIFLFFIAVMPVIKRAAARWNWF